MLFHFLICWEQTISQVLRGNLPSMRSANFYNPKLYALFSSLLLVGDNYQINPQIYGIFSSCYYLMIIFLLAWKLEFNTQQMFCIWHVNCDLVARRDCAEVLWRTTKEPHGDVWRYIQGNTNYSYFSVSLI